MDDVKELLFSSSSIVPSRVYETLVWTPGGKEGHIAAVGAVIADEEDSLKASFALFKPSKTLKNLQKDPDAPFTIALMGWEMVEAICLTALDKYVDGNAHPSIPLTDGGDSTSGANLKWPKDALVVLVCKGSKDGIMKQEENRYDVEADITDVILSIPLRSSPITRRDSMLLEAAIHASRAASHSDQEVRKISKSAAEATLGTIKRLDADADDRVVHIIEKVLK